MHRPRPPCASCLARAWCSLSRGGWVGAFAAFLYLLVTVFAYAALTTTQKIHRLQHDITVLTRELALLQPARSGGGEVLPRPDAESAVRRAELDRAHMERVRRALPSLANRQPAAYTWPAEV